MIKKEDAERIIKERQRRLDELSRPGVWDRYTKNMECGELREFKQSCIDDEIIIKALKPYTKEIKENNTKPTDEQIVQALERLKSTKDFLWEEYQEKIKSCSYPELKLIIRQTYEDNKEAFNVAIRAIEENNRLKAENEKLQNYNENLQKANTDLSNEVLDIKTEAYKEFAESLHQFNQSVTSEKWNREVYPNSWAEVYEQFDEDIDNLLKEMVGEG